MIIKTTKKAFRLAQPSDAPAIFIIINEVAPEIPLLIDTQERQEYILNLIKDCCSTNKSLIFSDKNDVVGFILCRPHSVELPGFEFSGLELPYIGVLKNNRNKGILTKLLFGVMANKLPLQAIVKNDNTSQMAQRFIRAGFKKQEMSLRLDECRLVWNPQDYKNNV